MKKAEIAEILRMAYKSYTQDCKIPQNANVAAFLIEATDWDLNLKINLYFANSEQVERVAKEMFNFKYE